LQTDHPAYWNYMAAVVPCFFEFQERVAPWPDTPRGRTRREIIARRQGLRVFRGEGTAKPGLDEVAAQRLAEQLPPPRFNADRRLQAVDRLE
jgi:tRNA (guanine-N7-)-methyltransferase